MAGLGASNQESAGAAGKRPLEPFGEAEAAPSEDGAQDKRARVEGGAAASCAETGGRAQEEVAVLPALPLEKAVEATETASGLKVCLDATRVEVCWQVAEDETEDASPIVLWWGCSISESVAQHPTYGPVWKLRYEDKEVEGKKFEAEERQVVFCSPELLVDLEAEAEGGGGGSKGLMQWRAAGSSHVPPPILPVGQPCKAKFKGGDTWYAGIVQDLHVDGTYHILYEDGDEETSVKRDMIEPVEDDGDDESLDETIVAHDIDSFFELFTEIMTSGPAFVALPPEKQRFAADRIADMRPFFREELERLQREKGHGYTVTGDDINSIIPVVMRRSSESAAAKPQAAGMF